MADPNQNLQILLAERPEGMPDESTFEERLQDVPEPGDGEVLVRVVFLSLDPAMRGWMRDQKSYVPPVELGTVMRGLAVGEVVESKHDDFAPGDHVSGLLGWQQWAVISGDELHEVPKDQPMELFLGPLGMTGLTAYFGLLEIGKPRQGETVLVSAAAGAVGSVVGQIAKLRGCRVVGTAGTDEKCRWLEDDLGFDAAINYKTADLLPALRDACPDGVDVYFDNVGGELLDAALSLLRKGARIPLCGAISQYNEEQPEGPKNYLSILVNRARMEGFIIFDYEDRYPEALEDLGQWVANGDIHHRSEIVDGLENAPQALQRLFTGDKRGKLLVRVSE